jgi:hypothetical protein
MQIPNEMRDSVVFLYCVVQGETRPAGTAFFVAYNIVPESPGNAFHVVLTAHHVIDSIRRLSDDGIVRMRLNTKGGGTAWFHCPVDSWRHDDPNVDCALLPWYPPDELDAKYAAWQLAGGTATDEEMANQQIGIGDEIFMVGLFRRHLGRDQNEPIVRVGNIAALPAEPIKSKKYPSMRAILVEARSIGGLSGSPVFVHMGYMRWIDRQLTLHVARSYARALGGRSGRHRRPLDRGFRGSEHPLRHWRRRASRANPRCNQPLPRAVRRDAQTRAER